MRTDILIKIRSNPNLNNYIKYHSYWYKFLIRNPNSILKMEEEMKKEYKLTVSDKINNVNNKMEMVRTFLEAFK